MPQPDYNLVSVILLSYKEKTQPSELVKPFLDAGHEVIYVTPHREVKIKDHKNLIVLTNEKTYTPHAINKGIRIAKGSYILLCGARSFISKDYIYTAIHILDKNPTLGCVGGRMIHTAETARGRAIAAAMGSPLGMGINTFRSSSKSGYTDSVSVPLFRKKAITDTGSFDEQLIRNQDDDYSFRLRKKGYKIWQENSISSEYFVREYFSQLITQFFQYGFWKNYVNKKHGTITTLRQVVPPLFVLALVSTITLAFFNIFLPFLLLIGIYLLLLAVQSIRTGVVKRINPLPVFYTFVIMHTGYGCGYLAGFVYAFLMRAPAPDFVKKLTR